MLNFDEEHVADLIDGFYEAAARPELWRDVLAKMATALGAEGCALTPGPASPLRPVCSASLDELYKASVQEKWIDNNIRMTRGVRALKTPQDIVTESMLFTRWELEHLPYHAEFINRFKFSSFAGMIVDGDASAGLAFSAERLVGQDSFSGSEIATLRRVAPHIQRAGQLALRLAGTRHDGLLDAFSVFDCGAVLLDWKGRALRLNAKAEALMGPWLTIYLGALTAGRKDCNAQLQKLVGSVVARGPQRDAEAIAAIAVPRPMARPLLVRAAPLARSAQDLFGQAQAVVMIIDPDQDRAPQKTLLRQVFGLTDAEAMIAAALASGRDIDEIALARGVRPGTIRHQVKLIFAKTNTRRQAELVALLLRYAPLAG
jgi:DNA-binding CsgD family transcriptional regulator